MSQSSTSFLRLCQCNTFFYYFCSFLYGNTALLRLSLSLALPATLTPFLCCTCLTSRNTSFSPFLSHATLLLSFVPRLTVALLSSVPVTAILLPFVLVLLQHSSSSFLSPSTLTVPPRPRYRCGASILHRCSRWPPPRTASLPRDTIRHFTGTHRRALFTMGREEQGGGVGMAVRARVSPRVQEGGAWTPWCWCGLTGTPRLQRRPPGAAPPPRRSMAQSACQ